ncbi:MAG: hypothetical protein ACRDWE_02630 [Acidimicrobiales bacterium]
MGTQDEQGPATALPVGQLSYTEASDELDEIVQFFEDREVDVDQLVGRLVRATDIIEELDNRLRRTRVQVEQLVPKLTKVLDDEGERDDSGQFDEDRGAGAGEADGDPGDAAPGVADTAALF